MTAHREILQTLTSPLLGLEEIGELADLTITCQVNRNGGTHAPGCRHVSAQATEARAMTIAELRQALPECRPCSQCGGGVLTPLPEGQRERAGELIAIWRSRAEAEREKAIARWQAEEDKRRADVIDERASHIVHGWEWDIKREFPAAAGYPGGTISAPVSCLKCAAPATITFEPRTLRVTFTCSRDSAHGYLTDPDDNGERSPCGHTRNSATWPADSSRPCSLATTIPGSGFTAPGPTTTRPPSRLSRRSTRVSRSRRRPW